MDAAQHRTGITPGPGHGRRETPRSRIARRWLGGLALLALLPPLVAAGEPPFASEHYLTFDATGPDIAMETATDRIVWPAEFTLEAWVYLTAPSPIGVIAGRAAADRGGAPGYHVVLSIEDLEGLRPSVVQSTGVAGSYALAQAPDPLPLYEWVHLAATRGADGLLLLYVDGARVASATSDGPSQPDPGVPFSIGNSATVDRGTQCCGSNLMLRNVKLWSEALTAPEVQASAATDAYAAPPASLLRFWRLDEGEGNTYASALPTGTPLLAGGARSTPSWSDAAMMPSVFESRTQPTTLRAPGIGSIWPIRIGSLTHYIGVGTAAPTYPETETSITLLSPENGVLVDRSGERLVGDIRFVHPRDFAVADFTGDGREDMLIADHGTDMEPWPGGISRLLVQQSDGRIADETAARLPIGRKFAHNVASADIDGDGDHDALLCGLIASEEPVTVLLVNDGTGHFTVETERMPPEVVASRLRCVSARFGDFDADGDPDLAFGVWHDAEAAPALRGEHDLLLVNDGTGRFIRAPEATLPIRPFGKKGEAFQTTTGDLDGDGDIDILFSITLPMQADPGVTALQLLINDGNGGFTDESWRLPTMVPGEAPTFPRLRDFDGDGYIDIYVEQGIFGAELYLNRGPDWLRVGHSSGLAALVDQYATWPIDFDGDGRMDVAIANASDAGVVRTVRDLPTDIHRPGFALANGVDRPLRLNPGEKHERLYFDVPDRGRRLRIEGTGDPDVDLYVAHVPFSTSPWIAAAPPRAAAAAAALDGEAIEIGDVQLAPGRWYVTPVNTGATIADLAVRATLVEAEPGPPIAAGHFYNPQRPGHGISYEFVAGQRVLIWYTYLEDGSPTWYYAQDFSADPEQGLWTSPLYRFHWNETGSRSRRVGSVTVTEAGHVEAPGAVDRLVFSWNLDGGSGSELMERMGGSGCPAGYAGNNGMWYAPSLPGYGFTVTYFPDYEFILMYLYDGLNIPRWLAAEESPFAPADGTLPIYQATGFCPSCAWRVPERVGMGLLAREFTGGAITRLGIDAELIEPVRQGGSWIQDRPVVLLTDPSPCTVP